MASTTPRGLPGRSLLSTGPATTTPTLERRASSHDPSSNRRPVQTPVQRNRQHLVAGSSAYKGLSASGRRRHRASYTPHAKAAFNYIDQRRAALTPGKRRQSMGKRRESDYDNLRALSRALAKGSKVIPPSSSSTSPPDPPTTSRRRSRYEEEDEEDEFPIDRPEMTLPLDMDDDDTDLVPHHSSILADQTLEYPRRAYSEDTLRPSLGRVSDLFTRPGLEDIGEDDDDGIERGFPPFGDDDMDARSLSPDPALERDDDGTRETAPPRISDLGFDVPVDADLEPSTFVMGMAQSSPARPADDETAPEALAPDELIPDDMVPDSAPAMDDDDDVGGAAFGWDGDQDDVEEGTFLTDDENATGANTGPADPVEPGVSKSRRKLRPGWKLSRHGHPYPPFPSTVVKRVAEQFARRSGIANPRIGKDTLAALQQATDWYFEQVSEDLAAFAGHAGRKTINESDMELVMKRQRQINSKTTMFSLATQYLPQELVRELRMPAPVVVPKKKRRRTSGARAGDTS